MTKTITALYARTQFGSIMQKASKNNTRFVVGKRGEPKVVIMGVADFMNTIAPEPDVLTLMAKPPSAKALTNLPAERLMPKSLP